ncbi:MAG: hypothetical protein ACLQVI_30630 [Polyangiaceae bacterium]
METMLVRLKPHDPRRRFVLRRFAYAGVLFHGERGWYRVPRDLAAYLRGVRQLEFNPYSPPAFDVCTEDEARAVDARERELAGSPHGGVDAVALTMPRAGGGVVTTDDLARAMDDGKPEVPATPGRGRGAERKS